MLNLPCASIWPEWELIERIGGGAYGEVYKAVRTDNGVISQAAIKIIKIPRDADELEALQSEGISSDSTGTYLRQLVSDFINEIQIMESFKGAQNIVNIEDYKVIEAGLGYTIYIRMELLTPFNNYLDNGQMTEQQILQLGIDICNALDFCSRRNVIHRDIKPENVFVSRFGDFKLGDFGVARCLESHTSRMSTKGTYNYMAPEVVQSRVYDARADLYSLGIMLYRLANGNRLPFLPDKQLLSPQDRQAALEKRLNGAILPAPANVSPALGRIILRACSFLPEDRYASAAEMRRDLIALQRGSDATVNIRRSAPLPEVKAEYITPAPSPSEPVHRSSDGERSKLIRLVIGLSAALGLLVIGIILYATGLLPSRDREDTGSQSAETQVVSADVQTEAEPVHTHSWGEWQVSVPASCEEAGTELRCCLEDESHTETQEIPALGHDWQEATYSQPVTCARCGATYGDPAKQTVPPTLEELQAIIDSGSIKTVSEKHVPITLPSASQMLTTPYRTFVGGEMATSRAYVMPAPEAKSGSLGLIRKGTAVWILAKTPGYCFFVADDGTMGWNGAGIFDS